MNETYLLLEEAKYSDGVMLGISYDIIKKFLGFCKIDVLVTMLG